MSKGAYWNHIESCYIFHKNSRIRVFSIHFIKLVYEVTIKLKKIVVVFASIFISGCAGTIPVKYELKEDADRSRIGKYTIVLANIVDHRINQNFDNQNTFYYSNDGAFEQPFINRLTEQLARHLRSIGAVNSVVIDTRGILSETEIREYGRKGYSLYIEAELDEFYGFQERNKGGGASSLFGALGSLLNMTNTSLKYGGKVTYGRVVFRSIEHGNLLWKGSVSHTIGGEETFFKGAEGYALETLKGANDKLAKKVANVLTYFD